MASGCLALSRLHGAHLLKEREGRKKEEGWKGMERGGWSVRGEEREGGWEGGKAGEGRDKENERECSVNGS